MKHIMKYWGFMTLLCIVIAACKKTKGEQYVGKDTDPIFCRKDTAEIVRLTTTYLEYLKNKEFDKAIQMLHHIQNDTVLALNETEREKMEQLYQLFPILSYEIDGYYFNGIHNTEVAYSIEFFEKKEGDKRPNTLNFRLNPQRIKDVWYLSILNR